MRGMPGIEGLGWCCLCGKPFTSEVLLSFSGLPGGNIQTISIPGFEHDMCIHAKCMETLETLRGQSWESLPPGPLRRAYEEASDNGALDA